MDELIRGQMVTDLSLGYIFVYSITSVGKNKFHMSQQDQQRPLQIIFRRDMPQRDRLKVLFREFSRLPIDTCFLIIGYRGFEQQADLQDFLVKALRSETCNLQAYPELAATHDFEKALAAFSEDFIASHISSCHFAPLIDTEDALT